MGLRDGLVVLFGGSGFVGNYVAQALLRRGARVRIASRHPERAFALRPLANLGQLQLARCDVRDPHSIRAAAAGAHAIVNLVGVFSGNLGQIMGEAPGIMGAAAREGGASAFVHVSAVGADADSPAGYARAKAAGEAAALSAFPHTTVLRPTVLFAEDDNFLNLFGGLIQRLPVLPVFGPDAPLQLTYAVDVAEAVAAALDDPVRHGGQVFELGGPETLTMLDLHRRIAASQGRKRHFLPVPDRLSAVFASLPGSPMNADQWALLKAGNQVSGRYPGFAELGIQPHPLSLFLDRWMIRYRKQGRFSGRTGTAGNTPR